MHLALRHKNRVAPIPRKWDSPPNGAASIQVTFLGAVAPIDALFEREPRTSLHGYGIARRIEQVSGDKVILNQGTIYAALVRLQQRRLIKAGWGTSDNNRKARFYSLTARGAKQLEERAANWQRIASVMDRIFNQPADEEK